MQHQFNFLMNKPTEQKVIYTKITELKDRYRQFEVEYYLDRKVVATFLQVNVVDRDITWIFAIHNDDYYTNSKRYQYELSCIVPEIVVYMKELYCIDIIPEKVLIDHKTRVIRE